MERENSTATIERQPNREQRLYDDTTTWLAEVLDGPLRTSFEYSFDGRELYGRDGGALRPIFETAISDAEQLATQNPELAFEVSRRLTEKKELEDMYGMAHGDMPNTMVVVSDFPDVLINATKDIRGYNVKRKQTMLRVITKGDDGKLVMRSQSLDRSDRQALEAMYESLGFKPRPGELLGQRMHLNLPPEDQEFLSDWLTGVYDRSLSAQYGGEWYGGRTPRDTLNTYDFVRAQHDLVDSFVRQQLTTPEATDNLRYSVAAAMDKRFNTRHEINIVSSIQRATNNYDVSQEIKRAGQEAKIQGKSYSGCGITANANEDQGTQNQLQESGYGNKSCPEVKNGQIVKCPDCKQKVKAIVPNKSTIYCSNPKCKSAHPSIKS